MSEARRKARQLKVVCAGMKIQERLGAIGTREAVEHVRIAALASIAECNALWLFLKERGLATEEQYQDYLDKGYEGVLAKVDGKAAELMVYDGKPS
jgi:hypothetical protein